MLAKHVEGGGHAADVICAGCEAVETSLRNLHVIKIEIKMLI